jgi:2-phosphoglycerate kinase
MVTGLPPERAYELARLIKSNELARLITSKFLGTNGEPGSSSESAYRATVHVLSGREREDPTRRLRAALKQLDRPLILLVGGTTGTGKSTVTSEVAYRLGITRVTSTDIIRQTIRELSSRNTMSSIYHSSFAAGLAVTVPGSESTDPILHGFLNQSRDVLIGVRAVLLRALEEGYSTGLEGVHIVPGSIPSLLHKRIVVQCLLAIRDEGVHASRLCLRGTHGVRSPQRYLRSLPYIRRIQDYLIERASKAGVPVVENLSMEEAIDAVLHLVMNEMERAHTRIERER